MLFSAPALQFILSFSAVACRSAGSSNEENEEWKRSDLIYGVALEAELPNAKPLSPTVLIA